MPQNLVTCTKIHTIVTPETDHTQNTHHSDITPEPDHTQNTHYSDITPETDHTKYRDCNMMPADI